MNDIAHCHHCIITVDRRPKKGVRLLLVTRRHDTTTYLMAHNYDMVT